jgi:hypothetical protein
MMRRRIAGLTVGVIVLLAPAGFLRAAPAAQRKGDVAATQPLKGADFLRFVDNGSAGGRLETADVTFKNADGVTVHLVSAVHIGERSYFEALNENFKARDAVLYEMVKPRDSGVPNLADDQTRSHSMVSEFQRMLKDTLNLEFQLDVIDYTRPNFVHADLDAETFAARQAARGESFMTLMLQQMMRAMTQPPPDNANQQDPTAAAEDQLDGLIRMICRPDHERQLKLMVAKNLADIEETAMGLDGPGGSAILTDRNDACMAKLKETLAAGRKDVAIFYGAAHMPDLSKRLSAMGFKPLATEWRLAWDLAIRTDQPSAVEQILEDLVHALDQQ